MTQHERFYEGFDGYAIITVTDAINSINVKASASYMKPYAKDIGQCNI